LRLSTTGWLAVVKTLFFLSGFTGLVFEVLWTRQLSNVVGATSVAMTCVFSVFILCLSLGALIASRLRIYDRRAMVAYGLIEMLIGVAGFGTTMLMLHGDVELVRWIPLTESTLDVLVQMAATFVLIGIPTTLMGATLPLVMNGIRSKALPSSQVTGIYGANVIGGALGALACGFVLLWWLGVTGTAWVALVVDLALGAAALGLSRGVSAAGPQEQAAPAPPPQAVAGARPAHALLYPTLAFLTGMFALGYELLWGRLAKLYMGDRTMAIASLLFIYLACMALGSFAVGVLHRRRPAPDLRQALSRFGTLLGVAAAAHLVSLAFIHFVIDNPSIAMRFANHALPRVLITFGAMLIPVTLLGMAFPFLMQTARRIDDRPGRAVGSLYFVNSIGAALGAFFGGFFAPRTIGTLAGFVVASVCMLAVALWCHAMGPGRPIRRLARGAAIAGLLVPALLLMPRDLLFYDEDQTLIAWNEDEYGIQLVTRDAQGQMFVKSNRLYVAYTLGPLVTNFTQETISYESCLLSEQCETILNIGTGYGITAGAFTVLDVVASVITIEVLPYICEIQPMFERYNFAYYNDPRVTRLCTEGRRMLAASDEQFDVITVNVMDPYIPGSSSLFTTDFWKIAKSRLAPGGVYSQLIWGPDANRLLQGLRTVFPTVLQFPGGWKDTYNVIAFAEPTEPRLHLERVTPALREALARFNIPDAEVFFRETLTTALRVEREARQQSFDLVLHTDDMPILEYRWARGDRMTDSYDSYQETSMFDSLSVSP